MLITLLIIKRKYLFMYYSTYGEKEINCPVKKCPYLASFPPTLEILGGGNCIQFPPQLKQLVLVFFAGQCGKLTVLPKPPRLI